MADFETARRTCLRFLGGLLAACVLAAPAAVTAKGPDEPLSDRDVAAIMKRGYLRVAVPSFDAPPFFLQRDGKLVGYDAELAAAIAKELKVELRFVREARTFNDAVNDVSEGRADIAICKLSRTLQRAIGIGFSEPYLVLRHSLALNRVKFAEVSKGRELNEVVRQYSGTIGVIAKSSYAEYARKNFPKAQIVEFPDWDAVVQGLRKGDITAAYRDEFEIKRLMKLDPTLSLLVRTVTLKDTYDSIGMAVAPSALQLKSLVNLLLAQREPLTVEKLLKDYEEWLK